MTTFKERLEEAMNLREISAAELSRVSGVNEGAISQYRNGAYKASQRSLEKLSTALRVSIPWLMGADVPMEETDSAVDIEASITEHSLPSGAAPEAEALELFEQHYGKEASCAVSKYLRLDNPDRTLVSSMMDTMLEQDKYSIQEKSKHA